MEPNQAVENLQVIRTLMERSAIYRRALAPIMLFTGAIGVLAAAAGLRFKMQEPRQFAELWLGAAAVAVAGAFLLARRQAIKDQEPFWSPPTRRVGQALLPPLLCGLFVGAVLVMLDARLAVGLFHCCDVDVVLRLRVEFRRFFHDPRHQMVWLDIHY